MTRRRKSAARHSAWLAVPGRFGRDTGIRSGMSGLAALLTIACAGAFQPAYGQSLTTVSWGGSYGRAVNEGINIPFTAATGIRINVEDYNGGLAQIRAQVDVGNIHWDVVDLEIADAVRGCDEGLLELIDIASMPPGPDGTPAEDDFVADSQTDCGVGAVYWSTVYAYNSENIPGEKPATMADFFDLDRFPGRRGMRRVPQVNLEFALIADGVPLDEVYSVLDTPEGLNRAFRKLDTIKDVVIWWEAGAQPPQMLADGEVVMSTALQRPHLQCAGAREPAVRDRVGRTAARRRANRDRGGHATAGGGAAVRRLRQPCRVSGRRRTAHFILSDTPVGSPPGHHPHRDGCGDGAAHARESRQRGSFAALRLAVVGGQPGRAERALQRVAGALSAVSQSSEDAKCIL